METNLNIAHCLRSQSNFGETVIHNICNGTLTSVPWGSADWALCVGLASAALAVVLAFGGMGLSIIRDALHY